MHQNQTNCLFCNIPEERIIAENEHAYAIRDGFPVTDFHTLVIPKRHIDEYFGLTNDELLACNSLLHQLRTEILENDETVEGFNIGMNSGAERVLPAFWRRLLGKKIKGITGYGCKLRY